MKGNSITHFGLTLSTRTRGYELTRDNFAIISNKSSHGKNMVYIRALEENNSELVKAYSEIYADKEGLIYSDSWCHKHLTEVLENYDLNMNFYQNLDHIKFDNEISKFIEKNKFSEIKNLNNYNCPGYYVMILDKYCQLYVGTSENIYKRIRQHWTGCKLKFDRLTFGQLTKSRLSIDSFRALDTTRILVYPTIDTYSQEDKFINFFSDEFVCNRVGGGVMEFGFVSVAINRKTRDLE